MDDQPTCGKGLAENSVLPAKLGELVASMAEVLEAHLPALDITDEPSRVEREAYLDLARESREVAVQLKAIAAQMVGYRDLAMGRHMEQAMAAPRVLNSFQRFVRLEQDLLAFLQDRVEKDQDMLAGMGAGLGNRVNSKQ
jgi:oligoribonuclease (3'-5' exoribonuclease)